ncbi:MAG: hypothetical protein HY303_14340, partial [Candidatus Wallbacteria bacterium]|nr:hypothetical protein [Candidatus Wallbacteria bacterium]
MANLARHGDSRGGSDSIRLGDGLEFLDRSPYRQATDSDGDGLPDGLEIVLGLDPGNPDTDGDGNLDGFGLQLPTGGTLALQEVRRVTAGGVRVSVADGQVATASDVGLEIVMDNRLAQPQRGRIQLQYTVSSEVTGAVNLPLILIHGGAGYGVPRGSSRFYVPTHGLAPGTLRIQAFEEGSSANTTVRTVRLERETRVRQVFRREGVAETTRIFDATNQVFTAPVRPSDPGLLIVVDNPRKIRMGLAIRVEPDAAGLLAPTTSSDIGQETPTERVVRIPPNRLRWGIAVGFKRTGLPISFPSNTQVHFELVPLDTLPPPVAKDSASNEHASKALPDLTVQTRSAGPYRIEVEYGGAVGFPSSGDGSSSAKRPRGFVSAKPLPVPAHIVELAARTPPESPVVVIRVKDSHGESVPDLAVRLVSRGSAGAGLRPISASFRSSRGVGLAVTDTNGEATGRLYFSGEAAVAKPGLAQVMVCVGEAAERSIDVLNAEVDAEGAITAEHRFTGHSIQFAESSFGQRQGAARSAADAPGTVAGAGGDARSSRARAGGQGTPERAEGGVSSGDAGCCRAYLQR